MKRIFLILAGILVAGVMAFAQSVEGNWKYFKDLSNDPELAGQAIAKVEILLNLGGARFTEDLHMETKLTEAALQQMTGGKSGAAFEILADASFGGDFSQEGDIITLTPDKKKPQINIKTNIQNIPMGEMLANAMTPSVQKSMQEEMDDSMKYQVISVTATELTLKNLPSDKQVKRGEKSETIVFTRQ
ncbi:MAG: hypothetical protein J6T02_05380 [Bacteroidales bacterium]|nr:hypothetical protein [Bacteroidales bacterium]